MCARMHICSDSVIRFPRETIFFFTRTHTHTDTHINGLPEYRVVATNKD